MGEPEVDDVSDVGGEAAIEETQSEGFSIGKLIEWLLANMIPVIVAVVLSTIIAVIIVRTSISSKTKETQQLVKLMDKQEEYATLALEDFKANTADNDESHFIRLKLSLAYDKSQKTLQDELSARIPQMRDIILGILNSKKKADLDQKFDKDRLKEEIIKSINGVLRNGKIEDIYYAEFVIT